MPYFSKAVLFSSVFAAGCTALISVPAQAQNLVKDGTFEAADSGAASGDENLFTVGEQFDGFWSISQGTVAIDTDNEYIYNGSKSLYLNADTAGGTTLSQTFQTQAGQKYFFSFWADDGNDNPLSVAFGTTAIGPISIPQNGYPSNDPGSNAGQFTFYSYTVTADSALTTLTFASSTANVPGIELDDIRVTEAPVPEASTTVSLGLLLGLGGLTLAVRRRKNARAV